MPEWVKQYQKKAMIIKLINAGLFLALVIAIIISAYNYTHDFEVVYYSWGPAYYEKTGHLVALMLFSSAAFVSLVFLICSLVGVGVKYKKCGQHDVVVYGGITKNRLIVDSQDMDTCGMYMFIGHLSADLPSGEKIKVTLGSGMGSINIEYIEPPKVPNFFF